MKITVVGSGYVGLVAAACFAEIGHDVSCVDNDAAKVAALEAGECPIYEQFLPELLSKHRGRNLHFTGDLTNSVRESAAIFIAVGTPPTESGEADLSYVESVSHAISQAVNGYKVVVEKSTVPVYTNEWIRTIMQRTLLAQFAVDVVSNPEFLREGTAVRDFLYPDRIVVGADTKKAAAVLEEVYRPLVDGSYALRVDAVPCPASIHSQKDFKAKYIVTSAKSAEMIKHASNAFLALKISFINAVANICEAAGTDVEQVAAGIGADSRIGEAFLRAGIGYGGSCFPKDLAAFHAVAEQFNYDFNLLEQVKRINEEQRTRFLRKVRSALWNLKGKRLAVLGLAFKAGTDDVRESPAIELVKSFRKEGCEVSAYDPAGMDNAKQLLDDGIIYASDMYEAAKNADAVIILTNWDEFAEMDFDRMKKLLKFPIIIDGRNMFDPAIVAASGISYYSVGRPAVLTERLTVKEI